MSFPTQQPRGEIERHGNESTAGVKADHEPSELGRVVLQAVALLTAPVDQEPPWDSRSVVTGC